MDPRQLSDAVSSVELTAMVEVLLSVTFACGLVIAGAHVVNTDFVAPAYDVVLNLVAFTSATTASALLRHWVAAALSAVAVLCWLVLARRTVGALRTANEHGRRPKQRGNSPETGAR